MPKMYGPGIRDPKEMQERDISDEDVQAYVAMGWQKGSLPKDAKAEDVVVPAPAQPVNAPVADLEKPEAEKADKVPAESKAPTPKKVRVVKGKK